MSQKPVFDQLAIYLVEACGVSSSVSPSDLAKRNLAVLMDVVGKCASQGKFEIALAILNVVLFMNVNGVRWVPPPLATNITRMYVLHPEIMNRVVDVGLYTSHLDAPPFIKREREGEVSALPLLWGIVLEYVDMESGRNVRCLVLKESGGDIVPIVPTDSDCRAMYEAAEGLARSMGISVSSPQRDRIGGEVDAVITGAEGGG